MRVTAFDMSRAQTLTEETVGNKVFYDISNSVNSVTTAKVLFISKLVIRCNKVT